METRGLGGGVGSMDGIFIQKRFGLCRWLLLGSGIFLALLFSFLLFVDNTMSPEDKVGGRIILVLSLVIVVLCLISRRFNRGAFLHLGRADLPPGSRGGSVCNARTATSPFAAAAV
mgnify:CR=1 FL=1